MTKKNVCYITVIDRVIKYFMYPHINSAIELGYEVTCMTNFEDTQSLQLIDGQVKKIQINISRNVNPVNLIKNLIFAYKVFKKNGFDMIQYTGPSTGLICSIAGKLAGIPVRQYCLWGIRYEGFTGGIKRRVFKALENVTCHMSTDVILDSQSNRAFAISEGLITKDKSNVIGLGSACGIDLDIYDISKKNLFRKEIRRKYSINENDYVFGYVGRITKDKGINQLLSASRAIVSKYDDIKLMLVGFTETDDLDLDLVNWANESDKVIFCGRVDNPEKYYAAFDSFVFPSFREGYGGGCIQAGAFGVPSIVSDIRPLMDTIDNGELGVSFNVGNEKELLEKMELYYLNQGLATNLGIKMQKKVCENFEIRRWMNLYKEYIQKTLNK